MAGRLQGKRCFVTAAGQGIGRATALAYAAEGASVVATDRDADKLKGLPGIETLALDVLDDKAVAAAVAARRAARRAVQLRRLRPPEHDRDLHRRRMGLRLRAERPRDVADHPRRAAGHGGQGRRLDRQHVLGLFQPEGRAEPLPLRHHQGGGDRADQVGRHRLRRARASAATRSARARSIRRPWRPHRRQCGAGRGHGRGARRLRRAAGHGAPRPPPRRWRRWSSTSAPESTFVTGQAMVIDGGWML